MSTAFPVVEVFGPTLQGEGRDVGMPCYFVRFGGCDFRCGAGPDGVFRTDGWVCDSLFAVLPEEVRKAPKLTAEQILEQLGALKPGPEWVIFSGGNPALHELGALVDLLHANGYKVAVETQGSIWKDWLNKVDLLTVSPKPPSALQNSPLAALWAFLDRVRTDAVLKVVIWDDEDLSWAGTLRASIDVEVPFYLSVCNDWQKPDDVSSLLARLRFIQEAVIARHSASLGDVPILPQLHVLLWGNSRGR